MNTVINHDFGSDDPIADFETSDLLVFSHLWNSAYPRAQHLMSRFARVRRVFFFQEPIFETADEPRFKITSDPSGVRIIASHMPFDYSPKSVHVALSQAVDELLKAESIEDYTVWYDAPMALAYTRHLNPKAIIYDCLSNEAQSQAAHSALVDDEWELMMKADMVFTASRAYYEAKKSLFDNIHFFPNGVDLSHFSRARLSLAEPADQKSIPEPRLGYFGMIDDRINFDLLIRIARLRPEWNIVLVGPAALRAHQELPKRKNIYYLGPKGYPELPCYVGGWDVAIMPIERNEQTRFSSPTQIPEYLAAGCPVVSTLIEELVEPYGSARLVRIASNAREFVAATEGALREHRGSGWFERVDRILENRTWEQIWQRMTKLEVELIGRPRYLRVRQPAASVEHSGTALRCEFTN